MSLADFYVCGKCNYKTKISKEMDDHWRTPEHLKHYEHLRCDTCEIQFFAKVKFQAHLETSKHKHLSNIIMNCELCGYMTTKQNQMDQHNGTKKHLNAVNGVQKPVYECIECNFKSCFKSLYTQHMNNKKHTTELMPKQVYECTTCNFKFNRKGHYDSHLESKRHKAKFLPPPEAQTYECTLCDYKCGSKQLIEQHESSKKHMNAVNGTRQTEYECIPCNFKSKFKSKLDEHLERKNHKKTVGQ
jgi:hypothetical protein